MTTSFRSRSPLIAAAVVVAAIPVGAIAASAPTATVDGPTNPKVDKKFTIRVTGTTSKERVVQVTIHRHGKCHRTFGSDVDSGSYIAFSRFVGPGEYDEKRSGIRFTGKTNGHYCAYLGNKKDLTTDQPKARSSKHFQVVE